MHPSEHCPRLCAVPRGSDITLLSRRKPIVRLHVTLERLPYREAKPGKGMRSKQLKAMYGSALDRHRLPSGHVAGLQDQIIAFLLDQHLAQSGSFVVAHVPEMQQHASYSVYRDNHWHVEVGMEGMQRFR